MNTFWGIILIIFGILVARFNLKKQSEKATYTIYPVIPLLFNLVAIGALIFGIIIIVG